MHKLAKQPLRLPQLMQNPSPQRPEDKPRQLSPGTRHWLSHRKTLVYLIPLSLWALLVLLPAMASILYTSPHAAQEIIQWIKVPSHRHLLGLWLSFLICHATLCLQTMIDDYIHAARAHRACSFLLKFTSVILWGFSIFCLGGIRAP